MQISILKFDFNNYNQFSRTLLVIIVFSFLVNISILASPVYYSVNDYGAVGDGIALDTKAIQQAIDAANKNGGGTVFFPAGKFLSGTIFFRSNVSIYLDAGATLLGSKNLDDYPKTICEYRSYTDNYTERSLIYAEKVENISILGMGTVDGQGAAFNHFQTKENPGYKQRPYMFRFIECKNIKVRDITIINSPMWVQHYLACEDVLIDGITVNSFVAWNNDGIDIDSCNEVRISNCNINSGDDAIVLKATSNRPCKNVVVTNCIISSHCNAFKLGTESNGGFMNITFNNSVIHTTRLAGIALEMVDGGNLERISINNLSMENCGTAIFIRLGNRARPFLSKGPGGGNAAWTMDNKKDAILPGMGMLSDVMISNIQATGIGQVGCSVTGIPDYPVQNITLKNVRIEYIGGGTSDLIDRVIPEVEKNYPEYGMFGTLPSYGFYVRHANNIRFENFELIYQDKDHRPAFKFEDVQNLDLVDVDGKAGLTTPAVIIMDGVKDAMISGCRPTQKLNYFIEAKNSSNIAIINNDFTKITSIIKIGEGMTEGNIFLSKFSNVSLIE